MEDNDTEYSIQKVTSESWLQELVLQHNNLNQLCN